MSLERAKDYLSKFNMSDDIILFDVSSATVELASRALGCEPSRIAKSLSFMTKERPILIVAAGDKKVDNAKYKARFGEKASMIPIDQVEDVIGHAVGGVCPFGINEDVFVYLDESLKRFDYVYPACGTSNSAIKVLVEDMQSLCNAECWVDVCKDY
jgi:prolyl-tRNA editing enzyme YbaK/EbsC (Cys-tRNA(Pro) deacylase)